MAQQNDSAIVELNAKRIAKLIRFNADVIMPLFRKGDAQAMGTAIGKIPAVQYIASQITEDEFNKALILAVQMVAKGANNV